LLDNRLAFRKRCRVGETEQNEARYISTVRPDVLRALDDELRTVHRYKIPPLPQDVADKTQTRAGIRDVLPVGYIAASSLIHRSDAPAVTIVSDIFRSVNNNVANKPHDVLHSQASNEKEEDSRNAEQKN
jgi:hypothetical protein